MNISILFNVFTTASSGNSEDMLADDDSIITAKAIKENLESLGHQADLFELKENTLAQLSKINCTIFFNQAFGIGNKAKSEAEVTQILDKLNLPYTGSGADAIDLSNDKVATKYVLLKNKIPTAKFFIVDNPKKIGTVTIRYPVIVKLTREHSSVGLDATNVVFDSGELSKKISFLFIKYNQDILIEEFIDGKEINATVVGNGKNCEVLPLSEITFGPYFNSHPRIVDFKAKWNEDDPAYKQSVGICPAEVDEKTENIIKEIAKKVHIVTDCRDYSRVDFRLDKRNQPFVLEINANPGIGPGDGAIRSANAAGYSYPAFLQKIVNLALERYA